ncbi:carbohydrate ABC transporter permease [Paenibacillus sp. 1P07SE]|uniref:carbohydrate ABC transporter permease n=1 Tax=Paenibacillus sp. 1P07SE TaxID=3132209 RepID=UPI0039A72830
MSMTQPSVQQASAAARRPRKRIKLTDIVLYAFLLVAAVATVLPILYAFFASFKPLNELLADGAKLLPTTWRWENYSDVWRLANFSRYFYNTIFITAFVVIFDIVFSSMFGYVLARKQLKGLNVMQAVMAATIFLGVGTITLYPKFIIALELEMLNLWGIIFVELAGIMVIHIFLIKAFCQSLSKEVYEAASIDGCGFFQTYTRIAFPMMRPILSTTAILAFQAAWNNFQIPYVFTMNNPDLRTLVVGVYALRSSSEGASAWHLMMAGTMMSVIPIVIMFFFLQKYFMKGLTEGSVKG